MKKFLPLILFLAGLFVVVAVFFFVKSRDRGNEGVEDGEEQLVEVPINERPVVSLTPTEDGHWLSLRIEKIKIDADSMDYELLYKLEDGGTQGVPGTIKMGTEDVIVRELLLGSESSGKFRYDEGVEEGALTLRFRNKNGKLVSKFVTDFYLQTGVDEITSPDGVLGYKLDENSNGYFVTMETFGYPDDPPANVITSVYGIFSSTDKKLPGVVKISGADTIYRWADNSIELETVSVNGEVGDVGIFAGINDIAKD